jgi:hypothetical protein
VVSAGKLAPEVAPGYGNRGRETPDESAAAPPTLFEIEAATGGHGTTRCGPDEYEFVMEWVTSQRAKRGARQA